jgi:hypothetical protein
MSVIEPQDNQVRQQTHQHFLSTGLCPGLAFSDAGLSEDMQRLFSGAVADMCA